MVSVLPAITSAETVYISCPLTTSLTVTPYPLPEGWLDGSGSTLEGRVEARTLVTSIDNTYYTLICTYAAYKDHEKIDNIVGAFRKHILDMTCTEVPNPSDIGLANLYPDVRIKCESGPLLKKPGIKGIEKTP